ncbi:MAG: UvrD-helicase domain-containing protein [Magnetococcales bacterium]|nr:UvrD-helicase domain-containing protein [Magnetococcales bacterium]
MNPAPLPADHLARARALDPGASFIVQAPAGSGKTGLLTQRMLCLLARVDAPEEVVALTFTRKAAGEMEERVMAALRDAARPRDDAAPPAEGYAALTRALAEAALQRDHAQGWGLLDNPGRLRILTLDGLNAALTRQAPLAAGLGGTPTLLDPFDADACLLEAARACVAAAEREDGAEAVRRLLRHLHNDRPRLIRMLHEMLPKRDQWLRHLFTHGRALSRPDLEAALAREVRRELRRAADYFPHPLARELPELVAFAQDQLAAQGDNRLAPLLGLEAFPPADDAEGLPQWRALGDFLLTAGNDWRKPKGLNKNTGFPPESAFADKGEKLRAKAMKAAMGALLEPLEPHEGFRERLAAARQLPVPRYSDAQWEALQALSDTLIRAAGELHLAFARRNGVDFSELARRAFQALGGPDGPSDFALALDYRLRHLLVDEFQDTSVAQFELLEKLIAGWSGGEEDGRTLFLVGDPMQSIYRFREAEVGLFTRAKDHGLGAVRLTPLELTVNFRSRPGLVAWVNRVMPDLFATPEDPEAADPRLVPFVQAVAHRPPPEGATGDPASAPVVIRLVGETPGGEQAAAEARRVVEEIQRLRKKYPTGKTALLVRGRGHLAGVVERLRRDEIPFQAVEIVQLGQRPVVVDLLALTRALLHPGDRLSWLAILRAPWCGLELGDLERLVGDAPHRAVGALIREEERRGRLSPDGRSRLERMAATLETVFKKKRRLPLRGWIEGTWLALGGPACLETEADLADAELFLDLLESCDDGGDVDDPILLDKRLEKLFAPPDPRAGEGVQVMTIHKAKGLEFDAVALAGVGRAPPPPRSRLMRWEELVDGPEAQRLLLAPVQATEEDPNPASFFNYLRRRDAEEERRESCRILYVALTRAREELVLVGALSGRDPQEPQPKKGSLLALLWPTLGPLAPEPPLAGEGAAEDAAEGAGEASTTLSRPARAPWRRLVADWCPPPPPSPLSPPPLRAPEEEEPVPFEWAGETVRLTGVVVHRLLHRLTREGAAQWSAARLEALRPAMVAHLRRQGVAPVELERATQRVEQALRGVLNDPRGRWLLESGHDESASEWALTGLLEGEKVRGTLDRSFVADGVRWIVDYKTGQHEGGDLEAFLDNERERYRGQLERYARLLAQRETRPIRLGIYHPHHQGWREWPFPPHDLSPKE